MEFRVFNEHIQKLIKEKGFIEPTQVQKMSFRPIMDGEDVLLIADTGIGKTEAAFLPVLNNIISTPHQPISTLYITPMKSLNRDLLERMCWWGSKLDIDISVRHGDTSQSERSQQREMPGQIFITTPETLQAILTGKKFRKHLKNVKYVIIDEIHELVESKRGAQLSLALERLKELCGNFQRIGLSATIGSPDTVAEFLSSKTCIIKPESQKQYDITVQCPKPDAKDKIISEDLFISPETTARLRKLYEEIKHSESVLVFTNTRYTAEIISSRLSKLKKILKEDIEIDVHHGSLSKERRIKTEGMFKSQKLKSLICTSSLELGIDIGSVNHVIQYLSPRQASKLIQRAGRASHRIGAVSKGTIISGDEDVFESSVISDFVMKKKLEEIKMHHSALDILATQIVGLAMNEYGIKDSDVYNIIKRSYLYKNIDKKSFDEILKFLESLRILWLSPDPENPKQTIIKKRKKAWEYYFGNLSSIPDSIQYSVISVIEQEPIGKLDEEFVAEYGEPGNKFVCSGRAWKIIQVDGLKVIVEPVDDIESSVPAWIGELIPVPFDIAQAVGRMRRFVSHNTGENIMKTYRIDANAATDVKRILEEHEKSNTIPDDKTMLIEDYKDFIIIHTCAGSLVNDTIGRYLAAIISSETGVSVNMKNDPYRIMLQAMYKKEGVKKILETTENMRNVLSSALERSSIFKWRFIHVAKRFGIIEKGARYDKINLTRLVKLYENTPAYKETLNELFIEKMDIEKAILFINAIKNGKIKIKLENGLSYLGELGLVQQFSEVMKPRLPEREIFLAFRKRIMATRIRIVCMNCGDYSIASSPKDVSDQPECPKCGSRLIGIVPRYKNNISNIVKKKKLKKNLTKEEEKDFQAAKRSSDLVIVYGKKACIAMAGHGIGPQTAATILSKLHDNKENFFKDILISEKQFARTKKYWKA